MDKMKLTYEAMLGLAAEMVLDDAVRRFNKERIQVAIDQSLAAGDEDTFRRLAEQWNALSQD
ncbi:IDEAL domain-containing protein [Paenibacillus daejeonensis]|uniref:IDEAL domain-containing protein n=1 Tax=Paenibacillus daejeonensis TaxID=135193 RepID=UPI0003744951|nr:IDEAL domain-containing protein [Paenibacillus daejeonensis]